MAYGLCVLKIVFNGREEGALYLDWAWVNVAEFTVSALEVYAIMDCLRWHFVEERKVEGLGLVGFMLENKSTLV